ncbi:hypothetical protein G7Y79_00056g090330 [Physcia stellaris]|nr:hypothetical protein G7Y79_00056g090330 [Physcia stellaris]
MASNYDSSIRNITKLLPRLHSTFDEWRLAKQKEEQEDKQRIALLTNTPEMRAESFEKHKWPLKYPSSQQLIDAGFKYTPTKSIKDITHCITCNLYADGWDKSDDSYEVHKRLSPDCLWLKEHHDEIMAGRKHACRRCPAKFPSNTKLHHHIEDHHQKNEKPTANESTVAAPSSPITPNDEIARTTPSEPAVTSPSEPAMTTPTAVSAPVPTPPSTSKAVATMPTPPATPPPTSEPASMLTPPPSQSESASKTSLPMTPPATPKKQISWAEIASRPVIAPKPSRLPIPTPKSVSTCTETASITCPPTPQTPKPKHQKPYLTIDDLFEMFDGKPKRMDLLHTKQHTKKTESSPKVSRQSKITSYFRPAANQNKPISQGSKTPNPRSFQQHTPAESNRAKSTPPAKSVSEKSAVLPYKIPTFSRLPASEISSILPYKWSVISGRLPHSPTSNAISASCQACRICSGTFESNNALHRHLRAIHFSQAPRRQLESPLERGHPGRNLGDP